QGPPRGTVLFGRRLTLAEVRRLGSRTLLDLRVHPLDDPSVATDAQALRQAIGHGDSVALRVTDGKSAAALRVLSEIDGLPAMLSEARLLRDDVAQGERDITTVLVCVLATMLLMGALTIVLIEKSVLRRLTRLNDGVSRVRRSHDPAQRVSEMGADELGE